MSVFEVRRIALVCAGLAVLSGCGGGGSSSPQYRIGPASPEGRWTETPVPVMEAGPASVRAAGIVGGSDVLVATSVHEETGVGARRIHDMECSALECMKERTVFEEAGDALAGAANVDIDVGDAGWLASAGVTTEDGRFAFVGSSGTDVESWGAWMRYGGFGVVLKRMETSGDLAEFRYGLAIGQLSDVAEGADLSGTWRGRMVGVTETGGFSDGRFEGDARLEYVSTNAVGDGSEDEDVVGRIDAAFTNIVNAVTGASFVDARFSNVPVTLTDVVKTEGGNGGMDVTGKMQFDAGVSGNRIRGSFFGPDRAEAGGVFEQNGMVGGFGATKE